MHGRVEVIHRTDLGAYYNYDIETFLSGSRGAELEGKVDLILTSPPFPLTARKSYGNLRGNAYVEWFASLAPKLSKLLSPTGSIVIEIGNSWEPGRPIQSTLNIKALLSFLEHSDAGLSLCQQCICYNPARLPSPAEWVTVKRARLVDAFTQVWWMSKTDWPKADNRRVLRPYSGDMQKLLKTRKFNAGRRPSAHNVKETAFSSDNQGSIAHNFFEMEALSDKRKVRLPAVFAYSNTSSNDSYTKACKTAGVRPHPARMPLGLANFFIEFLTDEGDLVFDPFAGSNTTGFAAERLKRRWASVDREPGFLKHSQIRFSSDQATDE